MTSRVVRVLRTRGRLLAQLCIALAFVPLQGCALLLKAEPLSVRFLSPHTVTSQQARLAGELHTELRLGLVEAVSHLEQRIAYRLSEGEVGYYQTFRWTEAPEAYLRRALSEELFDRRAVQRIVVGPGPTLDIELESFEELRFGVPRARVAFRFVLRDERHALLERRVVAETPIPTAATSIERLPDAMSEALARAVADLADAVLAALPASAPAAAVPTLQ